MRRASVIGPLLLILVGVVVLVRNLRPELPLADLLAHYWPFLLIIWGALRLIEIVFWAATSKPLPRSGISGGEWVLVIFLCLIGAGLHTARGYSNVWFMPNARAWRGLVANMGETYDYPLAPIERPCGRTPRIVIENFRGNARVIGSDQASVTVSGRKTVRAFDQGSADRANTETPLEVVGQGDRVIVRANQDRVNDNLSVSAELEITAPAGATVEAHGRFGDFDIRDLTGAVEITSDNAGVRLDNIGGAVRIELGKSDIVRATGVKGTLDLKGRGQEVDLQNIEGKVSINGTFTGQLQFRNLAQPLSFESSQTQLQVEKLPGQIHMALGDFNARNVIGPIRLTGKSRDVQISDFTQALELTLDRGDIELRPGKGATPKLDVRTRSGDIELALPPDARFDLRMATSRGEAHNDFGSPLAVEEDHRGATVLGSTGAGPRMHLETGRGTVTVRKATIEDEKAPEEPAKPEEEPAKPAPPRKPAAQRPLAPREM
jgi:DUF4097 and DUF4098 domain-containing protein YvlB